MDIVSFHNKFWKKRSDRVLMSNKVVRDFVLFLTFIACTRLPSSILMTSHDYEVGLFPFIFHVTEK